MSKDIREYDDRGNVVYSEYSDGSKFWYKYDENNNCVYSKNSISNIEVQDIYDKNNNRIYVLYYQECLNGNNRWYKDDKDGELTRITEKEFNDIKRREKEKEYLSREKCSRFEIMDI